MAAMSVGDMGARLASRRHKQVEKKLMKKGSFSHIELIDTPQRSQSFNINLLVLQELGDLNGVYLTLKN